MSSSYRQEPERARPVQVQAQNQQDYFPYVRQLRLPNDKLYKDLLQLLNSRETSNRQIRILSSLTLNPSTLRTARESHPAVVGAVQQPKCQTILYFMSQIDFNASDTTSNILADLVDAHNFLMYFDNLHF